ncbi:MAG: transglycosylase SLT domain-containing protein [Bryobacteraceae bacterium]
MNPILRLCTSLALLAALAPVSRAQFPWLKSSAYFTPDNRLSGIGVERTGISGLVLSSRTESMIDSQTFGIMRDPQAITGAQRITSPKLQALFAEAEKRSGWPASMLAAISYLESWGDPKAESPAGPKGIMQISEGTARRMGLKIVRTTKYRVTTEKKTVRLKRGKVVTRRVTKRTPYTVTVRDERYLPEKAIPAAGQYLAQMEQRFGGQDWAVFAYHCGEGCVAEFQSILEQSNGLKRGKTTVAEAFFANSPARNKELYQAIAHHMDRDYSPTYWFRIMRAAQLLQLYKEDPAAYKKLAQVYKYEANPALRAPHRLSVWLRPDDLAYRSCDDIRRDQGTKLFRVFDNPELFGFTLRKSGAGAIGSYDLKNQEYYLQASPSAIGALTYIAFETRRLHEALKPKGEQFIPLEVTSLIRPLEAPKTAGEAVSEFHSHCSGQVFDIDYAALPPRERECLRFVLEDIGWNGYLGFVEESPKSGTLHIGCAPSARDFFTKVYEEALAKQI